jgi:ribosome assembly protein 1
VIFCCAVDCWAFGTLKFANIWGKKLGLNPRVLNRYMFEEYYLNPATKKIVKCDPDDSSNVPMFVSLILEPIWKLYAAAVTDRDPDKAARMANRGMSITLTPREINSKDPRSTLQTIFQKWLPLPEALLRMVVRCIPDPSASQRSKFDTLFSCDNEEELEASSNDSIVKQRAASTFHECRESVRNCVVSAPDDGGSHTVPTVVFISKMTPVKLIDLSPTDASNIRAQRRQEFLDSGGTIEDASRDPDRFEGDLLMALGRVFSGRLDSSHLYYALSHRHNAVDMVSRSDAIESADIVLPSTVSVVKPGSIGLYLCFGPSFKSVTNMPAGNIVGIIGLDKHILKTGTLCSSYYSPPMRAITFQAKPILRVAVEPTRHQDLASVVNGLKGLYQFDPVVEVAVESSGQYTISCLGELHLELCLKALKERFAK